MHGAGIKIIKSDLNASTSQVHICGKYGQKQSDATVFFLDNQPAALIIQMYFVIKLYMFRATSLPIIRSFLLYIRHW